MSQINLNSAFDPLAPLQRWVTYTQTEILSPKEELRAVKEEEQSVRTPQQRQLDSVQVQLRDMDQRLSEVVDAVTELFNKQESVHEMLGHLLQGLNALKGQTQQQDPPMTHDHSRHAAVLLVVSLVKKLQTSACLPQLHCHLHVLIATVLCAGIAGSNCKFLTDCYVGGLGSCGSSAFFCDHSSAPSFLLLVSARDSRRAD